VGGPFDGQRFTMRQAGGRGWLAVRRRTSRTTTLVALIGGPDDFGFEELLGYYWWQWTDHAGPQWHWRPEEPPAQPPA
jgi:hypothetical protein